MSKVNRYCCDCGSRLVYYSQLSNPKAANEYRTLVYACEKCTKSFEKPKLFAISRTSVEDPLTAINVQIIQERKKRV